MNVKTLSLKVKTFVLSLFLSIEMVQEQIVRCRKRSVSPSAKLSNKLIRSVKSFSCISLPTDSPFFVRNPKVNVEEEPWVKLNTVQ